MYETSTSLFLWIESIVGAQTGGIIQLISKHMIIMDIIEQYGFRLFRFGKISKFWKYMESKKTKLFFCVSK